MDGQRVNKRRASVNNTHSSNTLVSASHHPVVILHVKIISNPLVPMTLQSRRTTNNVCLAGEPVLGFYIMI